MTTCRRYWVRGRVQGVGFRYFVQNAGRRLGLRGWVRNVDDGRVEVLAEGSAEVLAELEGALHQGPRWAEVRGVDVEEATEVTPSDFSIL